MTDAYNGRQNLDKLKSKAGKGGRQKGADQGSSLKIKQKEGEMNRDFEVQNKIFSELADGNSVVSLAKAYAKKLKNTPEFKGYEERHGDRKIGVSRILARIMAVATIETEITLYRCSSFCGDGTGGIDSESSWDSYRIEPCVELNVILSAALCVIDDRIDYEVYKKTIITEKDMMIMIENIAKYLYFKENKLEELVLNEKTVEY